MLTEAGKRTRGGGSVLTDWNQEDIDTRQGQRIRRSKGTGDVEETKRIGGIGGVKRAELSIPVGDFSGDTFH